jgi:hypothetical protein
MSTADCVMFANSGTQEELDLLCAHLGIFDAHCAAYEDEMSCLAVTSWEAEMAEYEEYLAEQHMQREEFPNGEFPFSASTQRNRNGWGF